MHVCVFLAYRIFWYLPYGCSKNYAIALHVERNEDPRRVYFYYKSKEKEAPERETKFARWNLPIRRRSIKFRMITRNIIALRGKRLTFALWRNEPNKSRTQLAVDYWRRISPIY